MRALESSAAGFAPAIALLCFLNGFVFFRE
jgi:hypothetical protein